MRAPTSPAPRAMDPTSPAAMDRSSFASRLASPKKAAPTRPKDISVGSVDSDPAPAQQPQWTPPTSGRASTKYQPATPTAIAEKTDMTGGAQLPGMADRSQDGSTAPASLGAKKEDEGLRRRFNLDSTHLDVGTRAGDKMVKAASGQRLKRKESYQQRATTADLEAEAIAAANAIDLGDLGDVGGAERGHHDGGDDAASFASTALTEDLARRRRRKGVLSMVPLWIQVCTLMLIPIIFVTAYLAVVLDEGVGNLRFIQDNSDVIRQVFKCESQLQLERARSNEYVLFSNDNATRSSLYPRLAEQRNTVDAECNKLILLTQSSQYTVMNEHYFQVLRTAMARVAVLRFSVDSNTTTGSDVRVTLREVVSSVTNGIALIAKQSVAARRLIVLKDLRAAGNRMGMCRAIGLEILTVGFIADVKMRIEYSRNCVEAFRRFYRDFNRLADGVAFEQYLRFERDPRAAAALATVQRIAAAPYRQRININRDDYFADFTDVISLIEDMSVTILDDIEGARKERRVVVDEVIKIVVTVVVSLVGVLFVSRAQRLATDRVDYALERTHKLSLAVQAFIPRNFLRLMSVTTILNLERGDQTQVAVSLLFADIRNFTVMSQNMSNEQLFDFLQGHLKRMTQATQKCKGFVANFFADAVSAVFLTPMDATRCAVTMQAVTNALSAELVAHNEDQRVEISVAVHHCLVGVGVLGNAKHHSCAIVSEDVNVPAQLESLAVRYGSRIVVTSSVFDQLKPDEFAARPLGRVRLALHSEKEFGIYDIFQCDPLPSKAYKTETAAQWQQLLAMQQAGDFEGATALLPQLEAAAKARHVRDGALDIKRVMAAAYDQHDMD